MKKLCILLFSFAVSFSLFAQKAIITGQVTDSKSKEGLVGVAVRVNETTGAITDLNGTFTFTAAPGKYSLELTFVGYEDLIREVNAAAGDTVRLQLEMVQKAEELDIVVVSGSKFKRQLSKETTSISVLRADQLRSTNAVTLNEALGRIPGVTLVDDQPVIRSGSGYSYGAGIRVLMLVDGLSVITADRGDVRWSNLPLEIVEQVEVLKASSSALYGASALNGVINAITKFPRDTPETQATLFFQTYASPKNKAMKWWGKPTLQNIDNKKPNTNIPDTAAHLSDPVLLAPMRYGGFFSHTRKVGRFDVVVGAAVEKERGYIRLNDRQFVRLSGKFRHRPQRFERFSYGLTFWMTDSRETDYFFWENAAWGGYIPGGSIDYDDRGTLALGNRQNITLDPFATYFDKTNGKHSLRFRYNRLAVQFTSNYPIAHIMLGEYQYQKKFPRIITLTAGANGEHYIINDFESFGNHKFSKGSLFAQADLDLKRLQISAGARLEFFSLDNASDTSAATFKLGFNYQVAKRTYLRLSGGMGYRYPSIAEFFVNASIEGVTVFPNPDLLPEYGGSGEFGIKQGIKISNWLGYIDWSLFWQEYYELIEFTFGYYPPPDSDEIKLKWFGFKSLNISRARVAGYELSFQGEGKIGKIPMRTFGGYTFAYPVELNPIGGDKTLNNLGNYLPNFFKSMFTMDDSLISGLLRYRYRHTLKADVEADLWRFTLGTEFQYYSFVEKIDEYLEVIVDDLAAYREKQLSQGIKGEIFWNVRGSYNFQKYGKLSLIVNNVLNRESSFRPAKMDPPLNFVFQYSVKI